MKKLLLFSIGVLISISIYSQAGSFCESATPFPNSNSCFNNQSLTTNIGCYSFVAGETTKDIELKNLNIFTAHIHRMEFYKGTCAGNNLILTDSVEVTPSNDTLLVLNETGLTVGSTYYIKLLRKDVCVKCTNGSAIYNLCLLPVTGPASIDVFTSTGYTNNCFLTVPCTLIVICANTSIVLNASVGPSTLGGYGVNWDYAPGAIEDITGDPLTGMSTYFATPFSVHYPTPGFYDIRCTIAGSTSGTYTVEVRPEWIASFTSSPNPGCHLLPINLTKTTGPPPVLYGIPSEVWGLGGGFSCGVGVGTQCVYYNDIGTYNVSLTMDNGFCYASITQPIVITNTIPLFSSTTVCVGQPTVFTDLSTCEAIPSNYFWNFGDGTTSTLQNPSHIFPSAGTYNVSFTVDDPNNGPVTVTATVIVNPLPPAPVISGDISACSFGTIETYSITNFNSSFIYTVNLLPLPAPGTNTAVDASGNFTVNWNSSSGGTISITVTNPTTGCSNSTDFAVGECCYFGTHTFINGDNSSSINSVYGSYSIINQQFSINGVFTVDQDMTWTFCSIKLGADAVINILPGKILVITQKTDLSACNQMWDKIKIQPGAKLIMDANSIIEDAKTAIYSIAGGEYNLNNARLNRNFKDIELTPYSGVHLGTIKNTNFTCQPILGAIGTLNPPFTGYRTQVGIEINGVQSVQIGTTGAANTNNFNNMNLGIQSNRSSVIVFNNNFKEMDLAVFPNTGIAAIKATGNPLLPYVARTLTVGDGTSAGSNTFKNCFNGIVTDLNMNVSILLNDFKLINNKCVFIKNSRRTNTVVIKDNDFKSSAIAIHCLTNTLCNTSIHTNRITSMKNFSTGIWIQEVSSSSVGAIYSVFNNNIKTVEYGIRVENLSKANIDNNTIETEPYAPTFLRSIGIQVSGSYATRITSNNVKIVPSTYVTKNGGIEASISPASYIYCNTVKDMGFGIKCAGTMPSDIFNNVINNDFYGLWLDNNGFIGQQDNPSATGQPSYNKWSNIPVAGFSTTSKRTITSGGTVGGLSPIIYKIGATPVVLNAFYNPNPTFNITGASPFTLTSTTSGSSYSPACPAALPAKLLKRAQDIAIENINFPGNDANSKWLSKHGLLVNIQNDSIDVSGDPILQTFVNISATDNLGKLIDLNSIITDPAKYNTADMSSAQALSNSISPINDIETNQKLINDIVINNYLANITYTASQISDLRELANKCPFTDGVGVYQARVLLSEVDAFGTIYYNSCETEEERSMTFANNGIVADENTLLIVYPNPATNQLTINYQVEATDEAVFEIYNLIGEKVMSQLLNASKEEQTISVSLLNSGVYLYKYGINGRNVKTSKLVIVK